MTEESRWLTDRAADGFALNDRGFDVARHAQLAADALFDRLVDFGVLLEELLGILAPLAEALAAVGEPGAALFHDPLVDREVEQIAGFRDPFPVHHASLRFE